MCCYTATLYVIEVLSLVPKAMAKVTGSLQKSTEIMKLSNQLIKLPQISAAMREMSMEMTKVRSSPAYTGMCSPAPSTRRAY